MIKSNYIGELNLGMEGKEVTLAGWVNEVRETAKITFLVLRDTSGMIQVIGKKGEISEALLKSMSLPKESVIMVKGVLKMSKDAKAGIEHRGLYLKNGSRFLSSQIYLPIIQSYIYFNRHLPSHLKWDLFRKRI